MSETINAIETKLLTKRFGSFTAVNQVSFYVPQGEIFGLLGPNGAGKTTTIRMLCGIMLPSEGQGHVLGFDIAKQPEEIKKRIGYMSQKFSLYNDLTPPENLDFYAAVYAVPREKRAQRVAELIEMAGLQDHKRELTRNLSGAWRQRLALARALYGQPRLIVLDEPNASLDEAGEKALLNMLLACKARGATVIVITHRSTLMPAADKLMVMADGKIAREDRIGSPLEEDLKMWRHSNLGQQIFAGDHTGLQALGISDHQIGDVKAVLKLANGDTSAG